MRKRDNFLTRQRKSLVLYKSIRTHCCHPILHREKQSAWLFLQSSRLELPHPPVVPGEGHTGLWERERGGLNLDEGTDSVVLQVYMYFVLFSFSVSLSWSSLSIYVAFIYNFVQCNVYSVKRIHKLTTCYTRPCLMPVPACHAKSI